MKWKITGQFLLAIVVAIAISFQCFTVLSIAIFYLGPKNDTKSGNMSIGAAENTMQFGKSIEYRAGKLYVEESKLERLKQNKAWLQVLDENGTELYSCYKPQSAPNHYTLGEFARYYKYSGAIKGYTIYAAALERNGRKLSYIMGYPDSEVAKFSIGYRPKTIGFTLFGIMAMVMAAAAFVGYIFSHQLVGSVVRIADGISALSKGDYTQQYYGSGVYRGVFESLNKLSGTLQYNEKERKAIEKMREEWTANISHDLKTPLVSIKGYSEVLLDPEYELSTAERVKYAAVILDKANYMDGLIEDIKLTQQLKNPSAPLDKNEQNLVDILRETVIDILNHPKYAGRAVTFESDREEILLHCDRGLLQRAFANIIYNTIVHNSEETRVKVSISEKNGIAVDIEDNGKGIAPEELDRLFERYYRGTNTGEAHKGSGLGMAIARQIIEAHEGSIEVSSELGKGTRVKLHFKYK